MHKNPLKIEQSATMAINNLLLQKKQSGEIIYNLSVGEAIINTSQEIIEAAQHALLKNKTHYTPIGGVSELKLSATNWLNRIYKTNYLIDEVMITCGGKHALFMALQTLLLPKDEVIIISPYWVSYPAIIKLFKGVSVIIETEEKNNWKIDIKDLEKKCTKKTKILIINNASNPTGALYTKEELKNILEIAQKKNILVISDEVYSSLTYDNNKFISSGSFKKYKNNVIIIQSCSKNFAMSGWRVGFAFGPKNIIETMCSLQSQSTSGTSSISQWAAITALNRAEKIMANINIRMEKRRDVFAMEFNKIFKQKIDKPNSSLYFFIPLTLFKILDNDSTKFCKKTIEKANIAMTPGKAFGKEGYVRCSFGIDEDKIKKTLKKLHLFLSENINSRGSLR